MDKLSSLGQLSAGLAHEIRNPLASINFNVQLIEKHLEGNQARSPSCETHWRESKG